VSLPGHEPISSPTESPPKMEFRRILVAIDGSEHAERGLDAAISLAKSPNDSLTLVMVLVPAIPYGMVAPPVPPISDEDVKRGRSLLDRDSARARSAGVKSVQTELLEGHPAESILAYLDEHPADLLVVGARGLSPGLRLLLGSVSDALVHHAKCPVLVVKPSPKGAAKRKAR
jgi:nucleotide-binding universal stress UspA family protein